MARAPLSHPSTRTDGMATVQMQHVTIDCLDPRVVANFWSAALGRDIVDDWGMFIRLGPDDAGVRLAFHQVPEDKAVKNRVHLDVSADSPDQAVAELVGLGATVVETRSAEDFSWTVMADPEGNEFCVAPAH